MPFAFWWGNHVFWKHLYFGFTSLTNDIYLVRDQISMAGLAEALGFAGELTLVQGLLIVTFSAIIIVRKERDIAWFLCAMGVTYVALVMFNPYVVRYVYYPGFLMISMGLTIALGRGYSKTAMEGSNAKHRRGKGVAMP